MALAALGALLTLGGWSLPQSPTGADLASPTVLSRYDWQRPSRHWQLPRGLREVSGLVHVGPRQMLAHDDNRAVLWSIDYDDAGVRAAPLRGQHAAAPDGDFEAITVVDEQVYLLGSRGVVYRAPLGRLNSESAGTPPAGVAAWTIGAFEQQPTAATGLCNFEGLSVAPPGRWFLACKYPLHPLPGRIRLYQLEGFPDTAGAARELLVDVSPVLAALGLERLRPSDLVWLPDTERLLVLVGKERIILELDVAGTLLAWRRLPRRYHRQAEGLSVAADGTVAIADEADGRAPTLSLYLPSRPEPGRVQREAE